MEKSSLANVNHEEQPLAISIQLRQEIGSLMYLVSYIRPDLAFAVNRLSQFVEIPQNVIGMQSNVVCGTYLAKNHLESWNPV